MIIIVAKQLGKLNPIDYSAEVSHALNTLRFKRYYWKLVDQPSHRRAAFSLLILNSLGEKFCPLSTKN